MAYITIKCNLPFNQLKKLCATNYSSGLEIGNLNHSRFFIDKFLELVNNELIKKTVAWLDNQKHVTVTLDVGPECGTPLLAVLYISENKAKLANITSITSKKGEDLATSCFEACTISNSISKKQLEDKIVGVTGDGAFAKGNLPFKKKCLFPVTRPSLKMVPTLANLFILFY